MTFQYHIYSTFMHVHLSEYANYSRLNIILYSYDDLVSRGLCFCCIKCVIIWH